MDKNARIVIFGHGDIVETSIGQYFHGLGYSRVISSTASHVPVMDASRLDAFFEETKPEYVILTSVRSGGIGANQAFPAEFIYENIQAQNNVIHLSHLHKVKKLLFLAASCIYPKDSFQPMKEEYFMGGPMEKTSEPYSMAKATGIIMCQAYRKQYGLQSIIGVPATAYGPDGFEGDMENAHVIGAMIGKFYRAVRSADPAVQFWGTGRPKREFIYADDLADACHFLLENYDAHDMVNIGTGEETPVAELAGLIREISGFQGNLLWDQTKPDGAMRKLLDSSSLKDMGWNPRVSLREGIKKTYDAFVQSQVKKGQA